MKKKTLSVFIPVYNEEQNIGRLLRSILNQRGTSFHLEQIAIVNDGSTDYTEAIVQDLSKIFPKIIFINDEKRIGKIDRLNQIYRLNKSEIIIIFDGDVILKTSSVIEAMVRKFTDKAVAIVGANKKPLSSNILTEKLINTWYYMFYEIRKDLNKGDNIFNFISCAYALKGSFAKKLAYPDDIYPITKFTYFSAISQGLKFRFAQKANIYYRSPTNIKDFALQVNRFTNVESMNKNYWGDWTNDICHISIKRKVFITMKMILKNPRMSILAILLRLVVIFYKDNQGKMWNVAKSTKSLA